DDKIGRFVVVNDDDRLGISPIRHMRRDRGGLITVNERVIDDRCVEDDGGLACGKDGANRNLNCGGIAGSEIYAYVRGRGGTCVDCALNQAIAFGHSRWESET